MIILAKNIKRILRVSVLNRPYTQKSYGETTSFPREIIENALSYQLKDNAEAAYARGTLINKRKSLMNEL